MSTLTNPPCLNGVLHGFDLSWLWVLHHCCANHFSENQSEFWNAVDLKEHLFGKSATLFQLSMALSDFATL